MPLQNRLRHTVTIERATPGTVDDYNQTTLIWTTLATDVPAWVQPLSLQEQNQIAGAGPVVATLRIYMMPRDIKASDRIQWNGNLIAIDQVLNPAYKDHHLEISGHEVGS